MTGHHAEQAPTLAVGALPAASPEPSDLAVAVRVAQYMLGTYGTADHRDLFALNQAYGAVRESLRILLRAVEGEPDAGVASPSSGGSQRCPAAHTEDPTPCSGPPTVTVLDAHNAGAEGCQHHGARLLASLEGGRVYGLPHATPGTAIAVFKAAASIRPFPWVDGPRTRPEQLSRDEQRARGEQR
ncbi:hypothetical protein [Streptomyces canus]|uniref:hypothetical protein n=1 Tax=Streptomyces canus TaxID=58343 RepID=UPI002251911F|nr:hypothetical protein [Streptomyces canus]MCX4858970.1 hypothetical protein [Streptomyces canus]